MERVCFTIYVILLKKSESIISDVLVICYDGNVITNHMAYTEKGRLYLTIPYKSMTTIICLWNIKSGLKNTLHESNS